ncbi:hypothetical protein [Dyella acidiphila]|uniref:YcxB family protein n=1 Tax=Dyella acidiphila TaxID=2775866 RepID=A0ABR9GCM9_9GAMM|nr:hypothetical protein [Dyella acidiphila]MBE1161783.1 hypothetical protein [Dyella acidiphila]
MEEKAYLPPGTSALNPGTYPRSYATPISFRLWRAGLAIAFLFMFRGIIQIGASQHDTGQRIAFVLIALVLLACLVAAVKSVIAPKRVTLTATKLTITQMFSSTQSTYRKDIAECSIGRVKWLYIAIRSRHPKAKPIILPFMNYDDAFWDWFSGIPGDRTSRELKWWS